MESWSAVYNTTNINNEKVGDVTNVYYYELKDGRNSSTLTQYAEPPALRRRL